MTPGLRKPNLRYPKSSSPFCVATAYDVLMDYEAIGVWLREQREERGIPQEAVASHLNVKRQTISNMERGVTKYNLERLRAYVEFIGGNLDVVMSISSDRSSHLSHRLVQLLPHLDESTLDTLEHLATLWESKQLPATDARGA